jgi:hypothetical protein
MDDVNCNKSIRNNEQGRRNAMNKNNVRAIVGAVFFAVVAGTTQIAAAQPNGGSGGGSGGGMMNWNNNNQYGILVMLFGVAVLALLGFLVFKVARK